MSSRGDFCSILDDLVGRTIVRPTCDELCPQILSGLSVAERSLKMKSQTRLTISSASATALIFLSFLSLASAAPIPQLTLAPRTHDGSFQSTNWSGYAVTGPSGSVNDAKGSWTVPAIQGSCPSTNQYSSFWVGIDGFSSGTVEQTGTDSDCQNGAPTYYAWYEFYPHPAFLINGLTITPGDHITAEASFNGRSFTVTITDTTTSKSFSTSAKVHSAQRSSAECLRWRTVLQRRHSAPSRLWNSLILSVHRHGQWNFGNHWILRILSPGDHNGFQLGSSQGPAIVSVR